jgi:exonuclease I
LNAALLSFNLALTARERNRSQNTLLNLPTVKPVSAVAQMDGTARSHLTALTQLASYPNA